MPSAEVIGLHPVEAPEPCHLVEVLVHEADGEFDIGGFTQRLAGARQSDWQVAYDEHIMTSDGRLLSLWEPVPADVWHGEVRIVFLLHHVNIDAPLTTPFGDARLPAESERPSHLASLHYEEP